MSKNKVKFDDFHQLQTEMFFLFIYNFCMYISKYTTLIVALYLLCIAQSSFINPGAPEIFQVSGSLDSYTFAYGSTQGGAIIYIKGANFSPYPQENNVKVGPYPCQLLADGAKQNILSCRTTPATDRNFRQNLGITVTVKFTTAVCSLTNCRFSYHYEYTPVIYQIVPRSAVGGASIYIFGKHQIENLGDGRSFSDTDIKSLMVGDRTCSTIDIIQDSRDDTYWGYNPKKRSPIQCRVDNTQTSGEYNFTELVTYGFAYQSLRVFQTSFFTNKNYTQRVIPQITAVSSNQGAIFGQLLRVQGFGFSNNRSDYRCTVAGEICQITETNPTFLTVMIPSLSVNNTRFGALQKSPTDTKNQYMPFLGSNGALYQRFDRSTNSSLTSKNASQWLTYLQGPKNLTLLAENIITQLSSPEIYGENYVQYVRGYFHAPIDGQYSFGAVADDKFAMMISTEKNNANISNLVNIIEIAEYTQTHYLPFAKKSSNMKKLNLTTGYYYFQIASINQNQVGFFKVIVEMPSLYRYTANPTWQIEKLTIRPSQMNPEIIKVTVFAASGTYDLYYFGDGGVFQSSTFRLGCSSTQFRTQLTKLSRFRGVYPSVSMITLDSNGSYTNVTTKIAGYEYTITINMYRSYQTLPIARTTSLVKGTVPVSVTINKILSHSRPLSGTYTILVNNIPLTVNNNPNLPYTTRDEQIQSSLNSYYGIREIYVDKVSDVNYPDGIQMVIEYKGMNETPKPMTIDLQHLTGGKVGTTPNYTVQVLRPYSSRQLYSPLPYEFLYVPSDKPNLKIYVNSIPALCSQCNYIFNSNLNVTALSGTLSNRTLSFITINNAFSIYLLGDLSIFLNGAQCSNIRGSINNFTCQLPIINGSLAVPAGFSKPIIHISKIGYANISAIIPLTVQLSVSKITPNQTAPAGLIQGVLSGFGFPIGSPLGLNIKICGNLVQRFLLISNRQIRFIIPPQVINCTPGSSVITFNGLSSTFSFAYNSTIGPTIASISKTSTSPILKQNLIITGTGFQTGKTSVFLYQNLTKVYELSILSVNATRIQCILGGGKTGNYNVRVSHSVNGISLASNLTNFSYKIVITNLSITQGHMGGGYNLTITGYNFGISSKSVNVFIGDSKGAMCKNLFFNNTCIVCQVPRMATDYQPNETLDVVILGRILQESVCEGICQFKYITNGTSTISLPFNNIYRAGDVVNITGVGLSGAKVTVNGISCTSSSNNTSLSFIYPGLTAGNYEVLIQVSNGWTFPTFMTETQLLLYQIQTPVSYYGKQLRVRGNGLPDIKKIRASLNNQISLKIISGNTTDMYVLIPKFLGEKTFKLNITINRFFKIYPILYRSARVCNISISGSGLNYSFIKHNLTTFKVEKIQFIWLDSQGKLSDAVYPMTVSGNSFYSAYLPIGSFFVRIHSTWQGFAYLNQQVINVSYPRNLTGQSQVSSFAGGKIMTLQSNGFVNRNPQNNFITVCDVQAKIIEATSSNITFVIPPLVTNVTQSLYNLATVGQVKGTPFGDYSQASLIIDNSFETYYDSNNSNCFVGLNFGDQNYVNITQIQFFPNPSWGMAAIMLEGATFQGSNDGITFTTIFTIDTNQVSSGWNTLIANSQMQYQYIRFKHNNISRCQLSQIKVYGIKYSRASVTSNSNKNCHVFSKSLNITLSNFVTYSHTDTILVTSVTPEFGPSTGGTVLNITGIGIKTPILVLIDGVQCALLNFTISNILCRTSRRANISSTGNSFVVYSNGYPAKILSNSFLYVDRWSSTDTWGGEAIPRQGDSVYVPKGMTLLVDSSTPILEAVIVQGKITFQDTKTLNFETKYLIINGGQFEAGTQKKRFQNKLYITLHGNIYDKQLPIFGNKVIGCRNCKFSMHGVQRNVTWTQILATIHPGNTTFSVLLPVDWVPGQTIVVASTSYNHYQSQERVIRTVSSDRRTITVTLPFKFRHYGAVEIYGNDNFPMRAEVGLLTRNIQIKGNTESTNSQYGSHLMFIGKQQDGLQVKLSYTQFSQCGQPQIVGRYCTHFHMVNQVPKSHVRGISVHHSFARVITIHGTHYLLFEKNVGYFVKGHNVFLEDGIQTNNIIQDNLMISSITSSTLIQSDITVASYWITNPSNIVRRNHAAGGDFYGFWYEIKDHPDGPSSTFDICPVGMRLGLSRDNVAHSNRRFGLRIFRLSSRKFPCLDPMNETALDPYTDNPAILSVFDNYTLWKNQQCGFLGEQLGFTTIKNFKTADSRKGGIQFHKTNYTKENVTAQNCLVVGFSQGNGPVNVSAQYNNSRGVIASRTDGLVFKGIKFFNFGPTMTPLQSCSECFQAKLWVTGGKTTFFEKISYNNIQGKYIYWQKWRREIFVDIDGTLTAPFRNMISPSIGPQARGVVTPYRPSLMMPDKCYKLVNDSWDNSIYCNENITLRSILFTNADPSINFDIPEIKAINLLDPLQNIGLRQSTNFSEEIMIKIKQSKDIKHSWALPFAVNNYYNIHWKFGIDFTHLSIAPSRLWQQNEGVVLRFNYSDFRQFFQIGKWYKQSLQLPYILPSNIIITPQTCKNGDYYHDQLRRYLFVCVSGRNKTIRQWVDIKAVRCLNNCSTIDNNTVPRETFSRKWSNLTQWPNRTLPKAGDNVTIPYQWNITLDVDPPILNYLQINGILIFDQARDSTLQAKYIWVKFGLVRIGSQSVPFTKKANIILHGRKDDPYIVIDPRASGNKMLVVTGGIEFYGSQPGTVWTRLTSTALVNSTQINVVSTTGWKVGDTLGLGPSYSGRNQYEEVNITAINGTKITFTPSLRYQHYGAINVTVRNAYGVIDTRTAVGVLNRNIRITSAADPDNWGCRVLVYGYYEMINNIPTWKSGYARLKGVQIDKCGQYDTDYAALRIQRIALQNTPNLVRTIVENSVVRRCGGYCTFIKQVQNLTINNNIFYLGKKYLVYVEQVFNSYNFTNNLLIGAIKSPQIIIQGNTVYDIAAYEQYYPIDFKSQVKVLVTNNLVQGSEGQGFVFVVTFCQLIGLYPFSNNTAGSCEVAFAYNGISGLCLAAKGANAYASQIGLIANVPGKIQQLIYSNMMFADNKLGISLRFAHQIDDNFIVFKDSYIAAISRPSCQSCYGPTKLSYCNDAYGVKMFTTTLTGQKFPLVKNMTMHDVICTQQAFDAKAFIENVLFQNFLYTNQLIPYCSKMFAFKRHHGASDATASHNLKNTRCINCQLKSLAYFDKPSLGWRGWFGGCGQMDCTGPNNYYIFDQDGFFTGNKSQLLANNSMIGNNQSFCTFIPQMNGHRCLTDQLGVLQYESLAPDYNTRTLWPTYLKYDGGLWNSTTNAWKEWQWNGFQPMNRRLNRFWSVIRLKKSYNLTFSSQPPSDVRFQIQKRQLPNGNPNDWAIVRIIYPIPNCIELLVKNNTGKNILVKPYPIKSGISTDLKTRTSICGGNNFYYQNGTIQFIINGNSNCQVRIRLTSFVQLTTRIEIPLSQFYTNEGINDFITNICAFLQIDTSRLRIVGVREGSTSSTIVQSLVTDQFVQPSERDDSAQVLLSQTPTPAPSNDNLKSVYHKLLSGLSQDLINLQGEVNQFSIKYNQFDKNTNKYIEAQAVNSTSKGNLILISVLSICILLLISFAAFICWRIKMRKLKKSQLKQLKNCETDVRIATDAEILNKQRLSVK